MAHRAFVLALLLASTLDSAAAYGDPLEPIDESEANALGHRYYERYIRLGCGSHSEATRSGGSWLVSIRYGYAGQLSPVPIVIDAETGAMSYAGDPHVAPPGPSFETVDDFLGSEEPPRSR